MMSLNKKDELVIDALSEYENLHFDKDYVVQCDRGARNFVNFCRVEKR
jgi:hypothetical protein